MIDYLRVDSSLINKLIHSNFTLNELETAAIAMIRYTYDEANKTAIIKANPCDPNILGIIGDMVLQVDSVDICIVYNECPTGYKLSVRSCVKSVAANDLAEYLTFDIGNGGGHADKAGGFIVMHAYKEKHTTTPIEMYLMSRIKNYADDYAIIYADNHDAVQNEYIAYQKKPYLCGYIPTADIATAGTNLKIRTLEGDVKDIL